jgi:hypothetical protein
LQVQAPVQAEIDSDPIPLPATKMYNPSPRQVSSNHSLELQGTCIFDPLEVSALSRSRPGACSLVEAAI